MSELKQKSLRGVRWTSFAAAITGIGGLAQIFILTRLLDAPSFALMGIINVVIGLSAQLTDMGFSNAILREKEPDTNRLHSFYWLNVGLGLFFALLFSFFAPALAGFFPKLDQDKLINLLYFICPVFILGGLSMQYQTLLQKRLQFKQLAIIETIGFLAGFGSTLFLALRGFDYLSLPGGMLARSAVNALLLVGSGIGRHRPAFHFAWADVQPVWQFSLFQSLEKMLAYVAVNFDTLMITKLLSPSVSGVYEIVKRLLIQPWYIISPLVTKVTYPVMAQVHDDTPRLRNITLRSVQLVAALNVPIYIGCAIGASLIVPVVFGEKWESGIEPFRWLALSYLLRSVLNPLGSVILAKGKGQLAFFMQAGAFIALLAAIAAGAFYGLQGMLWALLAFNLLLIIPCHFYIAKPLLNSTLNDLWQQVWVELVMALTGFGLAWQLTALGERGWWMLFLYGATGGIFYTGGVLWMRPHLWTDFKQMIPRQLKINA
jgi:O-antigen/teichoic acid export membrane protein